MFWRGSRLFNLPSLKLSFDSTDDRVGELWGKSNTTMISAETSKARQCETKVGVIDHCLA